jgi:hypothetical protein
MKISVLELKVGDYIPDFGTVTSIHPFQSEVAGDYKSESQDHANHTELVDAEMKSVYGKQVDRYAVASKDKTKCFYLDANLEVVRVAA